MANGIGSVWAANFGEDGKPNGVGSVWIANASALVPSGGAGDEEVNTLVHTNSATWNTVSDKLDTSSFSDVSGTFLTAHQDLSGYATTSQVNDLSGAIDYVSANAGSDILLDNTVIDGQNVYTVSSETTALNIRGTEKIVEDYYTSGIYLYKYNQMISGENGRFEVPFTVSANPNDPDAKVLFELSSTDFINGGFKAIFDTSGNSNASGFAFNIVDSDDNIVSTNSVRNVWWWYTYINCPVDSPTGGYSQLNEYNHISAELSPGDYKFVFSSIDAELVPSFSGWYHLNLQKIGNVPVSSNAIVVPSNVNVDKFCSVDVIEGSHISARGGSDVYIYASKISAMNGSTATMTYGSNLGFSSTLIQMNGGDLYTDESNLRFGKRGTLNASGLRFVSADGEGASAYVADYMTVFGKYNQTSSNAAFVLGNGSASNSRSDLFVIDYSGNAKSNDFVANNGAKLSDLTAMSAAMPTSSQLLPYPMEFVSTSSEATGTNILYVVTGSN